MKTPEARNTDSQAKPFAERMTESEAVRSGFTIGVSQDYVSNVNSVGMEPQPVGVTSINPRVFANLIRRKRTHAHVEYGFGYRIYDNRRDLDTTEHYGNVTYDYLLTRKIGIQVSDQLASYYNDFFSNFSPIVTQPRETPLPVHEVLYTRQRYTRNSLTARIDIRNTRGTDLRIFVSNEFYKYSNPQVSLSAFQIGGQVRQEIQKWIFFESTYSTYLNNVNEQLQDYKIHRFELGGLRLKLSRTVDLYGFGGFELADTTGYYHKAGTFRAGISKASSKNVLNIGYQHALTSAVGSSSILKSDLAVAEFQQRLTRRTYIQIAGSYIHSEDFYFWGALKGYLARAGFEYMLRPDLLVSLGAGYQKQANTITSLSGIPNISRFIVSFGLQHVHPSLRY